MASVVHESDSREPSDRREPVVLRRSEWKRNEQQWHDHFEGYNIDTNVTVLFYVSDKVGVGPRLHVHPYDEVFIVRKGNALFTIGDQQIEESEGDVLMGPAHVPHKYHNLGPGKLETTDIHLSARWVQTNLEDESP